MFTASIVTYKNRPEALSKTIASFLGASAGARLFVVDNSPTDTARSLCLDPSIEYIFNNKNVGYGRGHNQVIEKIMDSSKYHLVLNPDVYFEAGVLQEMLSYMDLNPQIGLLMPKVLSPDGRLQPLCKLLPKPHEILVRRFLTRFKKIYEKVNYQYEMQFSQYDRIAEVPFLSGCFMLLRTDVLKKVGLFDERFFLYFEDTDLSRRIHEHSQTLYYPKAYVFHYNEHGHNKNQKLLWLGLRSAIQYFNKWGWFNDPTREEINRKVLARYHVNGYHQQVKV